jgi:hypothetical protein
MLQPCLPAKLLPHLHLDLWPLLLNNVLLFNNKMLWHPHPLLLLLLLLKLLLNNLACLLKVRFYNIQGGIFDFINLFILLIVATTAAGVAVGSAVGHTLVTM